MKRPRKKKFQVKVSEKVASQLVLAHETLSSRGALDFDVNEVIDLVFEQLGDKVINDYVSQKSPEEYKLKELLKDPNMRAELERLTAERTFGLNSSVLSQGTP